MEAARRHFAWKIVFLVVLTATASGACSFTVPNTDGAGCLKFEKLSQLPNIAHKLPENSSFSEKYFVTSFCNDLPARSSLCKPGGNGSGAPSPAVQVRGDGTCLTLGNRLKATAHAMANGSGLSVQLTGGDSFACGDGGRSVRFDMVCDRTVASTNGPDVGIAVPGACEYAVRWRTPLACPVTEPDPTACAAAPLRAIWQPRSTSAT